MEIMKGYYSYGLGSDILPEDSSWDDHFMGLCMQKGMVGGEFDNPNIRFTADGKGGICKTGQGYWEGRPGGQFTQVTEAVFNSGKPITGTQPYNANGPDPAGAVSLVTLSAAQRAAISKQVGQSYISSQATAAERATPTLRAAPGGPAIVPLNQQAGGSFDFKKVLPIAAIAMVALAVMK